VPVVDQLDVHAPASLYEAFPPEEAGRLAARLPIMAQPEASDPLVFAAAGSVATDAVVAEPIVEALGVPRPAVVLLALVLTFLPIVGGLALPVISVASPPTPAVPAVRVGVGSVVVAAVTAVVVAAVLASRDREQRENGQTQPEPHMFPSSHGTISVDVEHLRE
jgi:hypothetical protein